MYSKVKASRSHFLTHQTIDKDESDPFESGGWKVGRQERRRKAWIMGILLVHMYKPWLVLTALLKNSNHHTGVTSPSVTPDLENRSKSASSSSIFLLALWVDWSKQKPKKLASSCDCDEPLPRIFLCLGHLDSLFNTYSTCTRSCSLYNINAYIGSCRTLEMFQTAHSGSHRVCR